MVRRRHRAALLLAAFAAFAVGACSSTPSQPSAGQAIDDGIDQHRIGAGRGHGTIALLGEAVDGGGGPGLGQRLITQPQVAAHIDGAFAFRREVEQRPPSARIHDAHDIGIVYAAARSGHDRRDIVAGCHAAQRATGEIDDELALDRVV